MTHTRKLYRYSDGNTYTDNLTLYRARKFQRLQNGGTITPMEETVTHTFTKGPWRFDEDATPSNRDTGFPYLSIYGGDGFELAQVNGNGKTQSRYNARLIAAAPELLEALEAIMSAVYYEDTGAHITLHESGKEWKAARAAIKKARGES